MGSRVSFVFCLQIVCSINIQNIHETNEALEIGIPDRIETTRVNKPQPTLVLNPKIFPASTVTVKHYLLRDKEIRNSEKKLFISYRKPHNAVSTQTMNRWIKEMLDLSGVDTKHSVAYSTRHRSTSKANR